MKLSIVLGTRPEVIKLAPVILEAKKRGHKAKVILTGQHAHLAKPLLKFFGIKPDLELGSMKKGQSLTELSERMLREFNNNAQSLRSDVVVVQGDTTSAFLAAYWAFYQKIPVAHVEAGLRTYDLTAPFPEEANRQLIGRIADFNFAPTKAAAQTLHNEKTSNKGIYVTGNTAIDALFFTLERLQRFPKLARKEIPDQVEDFVSGKRLVLVTAHRRESFGKPFENICKGIRQVSELEKDVVVLYPVHPNPNVRRPVEKMLGGLQKVMLCDPLSYVAFVDLMQRAEVLLTDSGGIQEEGPSLYKPIVVMREQTERPEGVSKGFSVLAGSDPKKIVDETLKGLRRGCRGQGKNPYGDGKAAQRIIEVLSKAIPL